jgi:hypothetical protein
MYTVANTFSENYSTWCPQNPFLKFKKPYFPVFKAHNPQKVGFS